MNIVNFFKNSFFDRVPPVAAFLKVYLEHCQIFGGVFCKKYDDIVNYFAKKTLSQMFDRVLNTHPDSK